jgi:hypothetical protein
MDGKFPSRSAREEDAMTKDDPSLFDAISTMIAVVMIVGLLTGMLPG